MVWTETIASQLLYAFGRRRQRVVADWRILLVCRRLAEAENAPLPDRSKADAVIRFLVRRGDIAPVERAIGVYRIDVPFAATIPVSDEQVIQEANPWAVFSHLTALAHHGLTDVIPSQLQAINYEHRVSNRLPLDTTPDEWVELEFPAGRLPKHVGDVKVEWTRMKGAYDFGHMISHVHGLPIYVTDIERTLLDAIRAPDKSGGIEKVLQAWREASALIRIDKLIEYTDLIASPVITQRVGYLLEKLGHSHARLEEWRGNLQRGGSLKLVARAPYSSTFSERWNLSLNVPGSVLALLGD